MEIVDGTCLSRVNLSTREQNDDNSVNGGHHHIEWLPLFEKLLDEMEKYCCFYCFRFGLRLGRQPLRRVFHYGSSFDRHSDYIFRSAKRMSDWL